MTNWKLESVPLLLGKTALVTGANTGIGLETARVLAEKGARVVLACRNTEKGRAALDLIRARSPRGSVELAALDLSDLGSVASLAKSFRGAHRRLDLLVLNAGVMLPPLSRTKQGFELQFGTNHLGHFALAGGLLPLLQTTKESRVVTVASTAARFGTVEFSDLDWTRRKYDAWAAYGQSKLANLHFMLELDRRLRVSGSSVRSTGAHPGWTATDLQRTSGVMQFFNPLFAMKPPEGALPTLRAALDPEAESGSYWGPNGLSELRGRPERAKLIPATRDLAVAARLWEESERLTGVSFGLAAPSLQKAG